MMLRVRPLRMKLLFHIAIKSYWDWALHINFEKNISVIQWLKYCFLKIKSGLNYS